MTKTFKKINSQDIKEGMRFSAPVFFDDGTNMFLAEGKAAKPYHIAAIKRWKIPFLLTYGHELLEGASTSAKDTDSEDVEDLETLEEL